MCLETTFTFYTYSRLTNGGDRWAYPDIPDIFYHDEEQARQALREPRRDITSDPENIWRPTRLEKIVTLPMSSTNILALLNDGVGVFVKSYEIIDIID